jgi:hypothetical protein
MGTTPPEVGGTCTPTDAFFHEVTIAKVSTALGLLVTIGGAIIAQLPAHSHVTEVLGVILTVAGQAQHALAHYSFQTGKG